MYRKMFSRIVACLVLIAFSATLAPSYAATACQRRALWEQDFEFIDRITWACVGLTEAAAIAASTYVPYPAVLSAVGAEWAPKFLAYAGAFGVNLKSKYADKHYVCRIVRTALAARHQPSAKVRKSLVSYGVCPPTDTACKAQRKAQIFRTYGLPATPCKDI